MPSSKAFSTTHLGESRHLRPKLPALDPVGDVAQVDPEHLAIFEVVQRPDAPGVAGALCQQRLERVRKDGPRATGVQAGSVQQDGKEVLVLHSQELLPEEPAGAHHLGQGLKHAGRFEILQFGRPVRAREKLGRQEVELSQCLTWVGRCGQQVSELLDECGGGPDLFEATLGLDLLTRRLCKPEGVEDGVAVRSYPGPDDVHAHAGESGAEGKQEARRVAGRDLQQGVVF